MVVDALCFWLIFRYAYKLHREYALPDDRSRPKGDDTVIAFNMRDGSLFYTELDTRWRVLLTRIWSFSVIDGLFSFFHFIDIEWSWRVVLAAENGQSQS